MKRNMNDARGASGIDLTGLYDQEVEVLEDPVKGPAREWISGYTVVGGYINDKCGLLILLANSEGNIVQRGVKRIRLKVSVDRLQPDSKKKKPRWYFSIFQTDLERDLQ